MNDDVFKSFTGETFQFSCHKDVSCFNECCAKLRLILTPYDILRLKNRLGLTSEVFLDKHTDTDLTSHARFPMVRLKMQDNENKDCPFVTKDGCSIYEDRPGACRIYPIGRAARIVDKDGQKNTKDKFFLVEEAHCRGFEEKKLWTLQDWMSHEGVRQYNDANDKWLEITGCNKSLGPKEVIGKKMQMFFMASYNLDKFRIFIFQSKFLALFDIDRGQKEKMETHDEALLDFAFDWLKFSLFGEKTIQQKAPSLSE